MSFKYTTYKNNCQARKIAFFLGVYQIFLEVFPGVLREGEMQRGA
jgi:hypothetical protein